MPAHQVRVSVILAHVDRHSVRRSSQLGVPRPQVAYHDLYTRGFDPIFPSSEISRDAMLPPDIEADSQEIREAESITIVHPNWWRRPLVILEGWVDRVLRPGVAH